MSFSPTSRRHYDIDEPTLNLNPMMDLFGTLVPVFIVLSAAVEVAVANVSAPSIGESAAPQEVPNHPPLSLTVIIDDNGYTVTAMGQTVTNEPGPTFPLIDKPVLCSRFRGGWPPPRSQNRSRPMCGDREGQIKKNFLVYNQAALTEMLVELKGKYPDERRVIIQPAPSVEYESIVDVMDATRDWRTPKGEVEILFDEVVMSPPLP